MAPFPYPSSHHPPPPHHSHSPFLTPFPIITSRHAPHSPPHHPSPPPPHHPLTTPSSPPHHPLIPPHYPAHSSSPPHHCPSHLPFTPSPHHSLKRKESRIFKSFSTVVNFFSSTYFFHVGITKATSKKNQVQRCFRFPGI